MLAIRCQFLQGTFQAATPGRVGEAEWPPHPARLHAAMIAGGWALGGDTFPPEVGRALRWLEELPPPTVSLPEAGERTVAPVYVPRNLTRRETTDIHGHLRGRRLSQAQRNIGRVDRVFPARVPGDEPVWFTWPSAEPAREVGEALDRVLSEVQYLGSSRSPVACALATRSPQPTLVPTEESATHGLRVPYRGMTDALLASRETSVGPILRAVRAYGASSADGSAPPRHGPFDLLVGLRRITGFSLSLQHTVLLTKALRRAVLARAGDDAPAILHGHGRSPHAAFLALPNVGHSHSTGEVLGLGVAIPSDATPDEVSTISAAVMGVKSLVIHESIAPWGLSSFDPDQGPRTTQPERWIGPSAYWRSATPIVLDRHPRRSRDQSLEDMVRVSFANALLPTPTELRVSRYPFLSGGIAAPMHRGHGAPEGLGVHVEVRFAERVRGPVLVGRGRYFGLGLFAPLPGGSKQ